MTATKELNRLPYDYCRCGGDDCDRKAQCLRVLELRNMGPRTPWTDRMCEMGKEHEHFITIREEAKE